MTYEEPRHPINFVAHRTGLSTHVIRVWERRRYAAIQPQRTDTNRRLYSDADVDFLQIRVRVLEGPGRYYLEIEQDESGIPYEIHAVTFSE